MSVVDARGRRVVARGLRAWLERVAPRGARGEVTVMLVSDRRMRRLNGRFRRVDAPTDVLSFPITGIVASGLRRTAGRRPSLTVVASGFRRTRSRRQPARPPMLLGDIVIATGVAARQAREAGHGLGTELRVLALHGLLHLLGYDHRGDGGRMARVERRLRRAGGLREGLIARARQRRTP